MGRNICIFSDGTGQAGGVNPVAWTHVYRLFTATRDIAPDRQICFYDPGLGADPDDTRRLGPYRSFVNLLSKATGYGITRNIIDCYTALLLSYEPGDAVFLFGFSRGAYTVRSLGGAMGLCGVPPGLRTVGRWDAFGERLEGEARAIATEAVTTVYQERDAGARSQAAARFRAKYACEALPPHFIGVWDTVKALGIRGISDVLPGRHTFNNDVLNPSVAHGRQALAIDENRKTFKPELWDERAAPANQIRQLWFAGVHSDIGGGYGLAMGLSDITLRWMIDEATGVFPGLHVDPLLAGSLRPNPFGKQHDELKTAWVPYIKGTREAYVASPYIATPAPTADTVEPRFREPHVPVLDEVSPYRPDALRHHQDFAQFYR